MEVLRIAISLSLSLSIYIYIYIYLIIYQTILSTMSIIETRNPKYNFWGHDAIKSFVENILVFFFKFCWY